jgi:DNA adenine methylase
MYISPLRYPGGKQKIWRFIADIISTNNITGGNYVEPYAGGAGVALELLIKNLVRIIHLNDSCPGIYAFWHSVLNHADELCRRISRASLTIEEWKKQREIIRNPKNVARIDLGFALFYLNRCNRSGIIQGGVIGGLKQYGKWKMDARFPRNELIRRIEVIASRSACIKLRNWDAEKYLINYVSKLPRNTLVYCDPPYFNKSERLYMNHYTPFDHIRISKIIQNQGRARKWIVSYDNVPEISKYYRDKRKLLYKIRYNAADSCGVNEIFLFSNNLVIPAGISRNLFISPRNKHKISVNLAG